MDKPSSKLGFAVGDYQLTGKLGDDYVHSTDLRPGDECSGLIDGAELLFVGHGVDAPHLEWDDFKGVDVVGKVLLVLVNHPSDPPFPDDDMLYYGRWTYKFEEARRRGAAGCLIIHHSDEEAGYPWSVTRTGYSGEKINLEVQQHAQKPQALTWLQAPEEHPLQLHGWLNRGLGDKLAHACGASLENWVGQAQHTEFVPIVVGKITHTARYQLRQLSGRNVIGVVTGKQSCCCDVQCI